MKNALQEALRGAGVVRSHRAEKIYFHQNRSFLLIFTCARCIVPEGIQVHPFCGGNTSSSLPPEEGVRRFSEATVDFGGLMSRCSVESINVVGDEKHCEVYLECVATSAGGGLRHWEGLYGDFVRKRLNGYVWKSATYKPNGSGGRPSLKCSGVSKGAATTRVFFVIEAPSAHR